MTIPVPVFNQAVLLSCISVSGGREDAFRAKYETAAAQVRRRYEMNGLPSPRKIELSSDAFGKPELICDGRSGPSISFAFCGRKLWTALSLTENAIGVDAAEAGEFSGSYPFARVFSPTEMEFILKGDAPPPESAALLWSAKEACVKALGLGFHLFGPDAVEVEVSETDGVFGGRAAVNFPDDAAISHPAVSLRSFHYECGWLSIGLSEV
ncbi:MAG: 4'-phosphopantetheinyl transferase superfamily protein [Syntrophales bacterium]|nr:4'-phosphopantetheinyl transferase superfamily protein [Syntrophales bacterium]